MDIASAIRSVIDRKLPPSISPMYWVKRKVEEAADWTIGGGPFKGMPYIRRARGSALHPKLLGTYERELFGVMGEVRALNVGQAVVIGAAEGYYAVGLLRFNFAKRVTAYELDTKSHKLVEDLAKLNGVWDRIDLHGACEIANLEPTLTENAFVLCDVEGYEDVLMDPAKLPALKSAAILIETHDHLVPDIHEEMKRRFAGTHDIREIAVDERDPSENPHRDLYTRLMPRYYQMLVVGEGRPEGNAWLWMKPRAVSQ